MINIVIPMAGAGSRFEGRTSKPKPFVEINEKPMIKWVIDNYSFLSIEAHRFILIVQRAHINERRLGFLQKIPNLEVVWLDKVLQGTVCSLLAGEHAVPKSESMIVTNCDQYFEKGLPQLVQAGQGHNGASLIHRGPQDGNWAYVRLINGKIAEVREKSAFSPHVMSGSCYIERSVDFFDAARMIINKKRLTRSEYYFGTVIDEMLVTGHTFNSYEIESKDLVSFGTPSDLDKLGLSWI